MRKKEEVKIQDFMGKFFFLAPYLLGPWTISATWLHVGAPQKIKIKINLISISNKTLPRAHTELELDVLDFPIKLVKYVQ
jgi:hypothetical protein